MDVQLSADRTNKLVALEDRVQAIGSLIAKARRANLPVDALQAQLDQVEAMRRGLLVEFGAGSQTRRATG